jgi:hypothetical protein
VRLEEFHRELDTQKPVALPGFSLCQKRSSVAAKKSAVIPPASWRQVAPIPFQNGASKAPVRFAGRALAVLLRWMESEVINTSYYLYYKRSLIENAYFVEAGPRKLPQTTDN